MSEVRERRRPVRREWNSELQGSYGRFSTIYSFPIDYFLTSFDINEVMSDLNFARDLHLGEAMHRDFDLMMQRDIDEERVKDDIQPYLSGPKNLTNEAIFFPPLLVAIVPVNDGRIKESYPDYSATENEDNESLDIIWPKNFKLNLFLDESGTEIKYGEQRFQVQTDTAELNLRISKSNEEGVKLVVIDGQHRLLALKMMNKVDQESIRNISIPICFIFPPESTVSKVELTGSRAPTVPEIFRKLFVDVNTTMKTVGGHFNILLGDRNIGDLSCRIFCEEVLRDLGVSELSAIEWNTKTSKEGWTITKQHSITSIGVVWKALKESIGTTIETTDYFLNLSDRKDELQPEGSDLDEFPRVKWDRFTLAQKNILQEQIRKLLIPILFNLYFRQTNFKSAFKDYKDEFSILEEERDQDKDIEKSESADKVIKQLTEYRPIPDSNKSAKKRLSDFNTGIQHRRKASGTTILGFALFQRAIFIALFEVGVVTKRHDYSPAIAISVVMKLIETLLRDNGENVGWDKPYMQYLVFNRNRIIAKEETRKPLANLLLCQMANKNFIEEELVESLNGDEGFSSDLHQLGHTAGTNLVAYYRKEREKVIKRSYPVDPDVLTQDRRDMAIAEQTFNEHMAEVRKGQRADEDVDRSFMNYVSKYTNELTDQFYSQIRGLFDIQTGFGGLEKDEEDDSEESQI